MAKKNQENIIENAEKREKKSVLRSYIFAIVLIISFFVSIIVAMSYCHIHPENLSYTNVIMNLIGLVFVLLLVFFCLYGRITQGRKGFLFLCVLVSLALEFWLVSIFSMMEGHAEYSLHIQWFVSAYYFVSLLTFVFIWLFTMEYFPKRKWHTFINIVFMFNLFVYAVLIACNFDTEIFFNVNFDLGTIEYLNNDIVTYSITAVWVIIYMFIVIASKLAPSAKVAFLSNCVMSFLVIVYNSVYTFLGKESYVLLDEIAKLIPAYIVFFYYFIDERNNLLKEKKDNAEMKTAIMISQIQPHFVYNTLATISGLCRKEKATKTREVVNKFADYLRVNIDALQFHQMIPFDKEMEHVKTYVWIEKTRFDDDVNVEYDLQYTDFEIPVLTVQPLVENAIKHGICAKENGGTIKISSRREKEYAIVEVKDDGVGFDMNAKKNDGRAHVGLTNIRSRLEAMNNGQLEIASEVGVGTTATLKIYLGRKK